MFENHQWKSDSLSSVTLPQVILKHFASKNQLLGFYRSGTLAENGLRSLLELKIQEQPSWYVLRNSSFLIFLVNRRILTSLIQPIKCQCCPPIETSQLICTANQLTDFYMRATLALDGLRQFIFSKESWVSTNSFSIKYTSFSRGFNGNQDVSVVPLLIT